MTVTATARAAPLRLLLAGDAMLGRGVATWIRRCGPAYPLGALGGLLEAPDLVIANLECALTRRSRHWSGAPKAFYFGAPPEAAQTLAGAGIRLASLANNHVLDFGVEGLHDTLAALERHGIAHAGAGAGDGIAAARRPALVDCRGVRIGMAAFCDHQADFAAAPGHPGIAWLDLHDEPAALAAFAQALAALREAGADWPILSLHWGPNMVWQPRPRFRRLARGAVDMGWKIVFGHSAHVFQGIELYRGFPILYAVGDLVDDYAVDPAFRNDHQLLFELELAAGRLGAILLHPIFIARCRTRPAAPDQARWTAGRMGALCDQLGTRIDTAGGPWRIAPGQA
ncbi:CapA family protein [Massilia sp. UMI-21]|nr:CapA family protein [Massilia sp. UMI-21]